MNSIQWISKLASTALLAAMLAWLAPVSALAEQAPAQAAVTASVNVNTAGASEIAAAINGIGMTKAQAIVAYREQHGPFKSIDDLVKVKGVGAKTVERNRSRISL